MDPVKLPFDLQAREQMLLFARRHPVFLALRLGWALIVAIVPPLVLAILVAITAGLGGTAGLVVLAVSALWLLFFGIRAYFVWYRYQNDIWAVTNQRVVDSSKHHWFHHRMASAELIDIEDIQVHREGLLATAFKFGDVRCQTAGEVPNFILSGIPKPSSVLATIDSARDAARRELASPATALD